VEKILENLPPRSAVVNSDASPRQNDFEAVIAKAFNIAIILTGSTDLAEYAVSEAIRVWNETKPLEQTLCLGATIAAIEVQRLSSTNRPPEMDSAAARLPLRLRNVVRLTPTIRNCFVLRILLGLCYETCARLLNSNAEQVIANICVALQTLADLDKTTNKEREWPFYEGHASSRQRYFKRID
jgi:hypothetical protein